MIRLHQADRAAQLLQEQATLQRYALLFAHGLALEDLEQGLPILRDSFVPALCEQIRPGTLEEEARIIPADTRP